MSMILPDADEIAALNRGLEADLARDYAELGERLARRGVSIDAVKARVASFTLALPTWGVGRGGTRFARFPIAGEPTDIHEKLQDCGLVRRLCVVTTRVSPHFPWDSTSDLAALRDEAHQLGLGFDAVNSNTFQDGLGQARSYATGSLASPCAATRAQAIEHNLACIDIGKALGSRALTVWIGDGSNLPGQHHLARAFDRYLESSAAIHAALPEDWMMLLEHKLYEPAFYSTVLADWGSSILAAQTLGSKAKCLVDLGHHAPTVNIEQIVARLHRFGRLGGFHFNDSKYGDDDLDSGSIDPHRLFLVFNELVEAEREEPANFAPAYMIDQSHNVTDPIESLLSSAEAIVEAFAKALLVDREELSAAQDASDALGAFRALRAAFRTDVSPITAMARAQGGGAIDPIGAYRTLDWRKRAAVCRTAVAGGAGIV
jgi:L-rhamnose isomerase / sugar isomerase